MRAFLKKKTLRDEIGQGISNYFLDNARSVASQLVLWEAHKAVIKGQCIAIESRIKKRMLQVESLWGQLQLLEQKLATKPSRRTLRQILNIRSKLKTLALGRVEKLLLY